MDNKEEISGFLAQAEKLMQNGKFAEAEERVRFALSEISSDESTSYSAKKNTARGWNIISQSFWRTGRYDIAKKYAFDALSLAQEIDDKYGEATSRSNIGSVYHSISDFPNALEYYRSALSINEELHNRVGIAAQLGNIGIVYRELSDYPRALEFYRKSLTIHEELGNKIGIARNLGNIGIVYQYLADYPRALEHFQKALSLNQEIGHRTGIWYGNIGNIYEDLRDYEQALEFYQKALAIDKELDSKPSIAVWLGNIGSVCVRIADFSRALEFLNKALSLSEELGYQASIASNLASLGALYGNQHFHDYSFEKAEDFLFRALTLCEELGEKSERFEIHKSLSELYKHEGRWQEAYEHSEQFHTIKDEINSEEIRQKAQYLAMDREMAVLQREQEVLKIKNGELAELNEELEKKNENLRLLNEEKNEFLGIASHDLKNPLTAIISSVQLLSRQGDRISSEKIIEKLHSIESSATYMRRIIVNLLDVNAIESGVFSMNCIPVHAGNIAEHTCIAYRDASLEKHIHLHFSKNDDTIAVADQNALVQILENLISNAVKYSPKGRNIAVSVKKLG